MYVFHKLTKSPFCFIEVRSEGKIECFNGEVNVKYTEVCFRKMFTMKPEKLKNAIININ